MIKSYRLIVLLFSACLIVSCRDNKAVSYKDSSVAEKDTITELPKDTLVVEEVVDPVKEKKILKIENENFEEFFYSFLTDTKYQYRRINFPIKVMNVAGESSAISKDAWKVNNDVDKQEYYCLFFDNEDDIETLNDSVTYNMPVFVSKKDEGIIQTYNFVKGQKGWILDSITEQKKEEEQNDFGRFFNQFVCDSIFQSERVKTPVVYVTTDPDNDFEIIESDIDLDQWHSFKPHYNNNDFAYIDFSKTDGGVKIVVWKGFANGDSVILHFKKIGGKWMLVKLEDTGV